MKCWQCGYDLRLHEGATCPECGSSKSPPALRLRDAPLIFTWGFAAALTLQLCAVVIADGGDGSYLPLIVLFAPAALPFVGLAFFAALPLYLAYAAVLTSVRTFEARRWALLAICGVHYISLLFFVILRQGEFEAEWLSFLDARRDFRAPMAVAAVVFIATHVALALWAFPLRDAQSNPPSN